MAWQSINRVPARFLRLVLRTRCTRRSRRRCRPSGTTTRSTMTGLSPSATKRPTVLSRRRLAALTASCAESTATSTQTATRESLATFRATPATRTRPKTRRKRCQRRRRKNSLDQRIIPSSDPCNDPSR